jgi:hypothetical protein
VTHRSKPIPCSSLGGWARILVFLLKCRTLSSTGRPDCKWYTFMKVVDADLTNYKDLDDDTLNEFLSCYGDDVVTLFYFYAKS